MKLLLLFILLYSQVVNAYETNVDSLFELDIIKLLGNYPAIDSDLEKQDMATLLNYQNTRTKADCLAASLEVKPSIETFFAGPKGPLTFDEIRSIKKSLNLKLIRTGIDIEIAKLYFNRQRPYITHPEIKPCIDLEKSKSYPSGHATLARMYARVLGEIFPERKVELLRRGDDVALNRVIGGVHHPTDIEAGKKLGDALANKFLSSYDDFISED